MKVPPTSVVSRLCQAAEECGQVNLALLNTLEAGGPLQTIQSPGLISGLLINYTLVLAVRVSSKIVDSPFAA